MAPPFDFFKKVSQSPTNPQPAKARKKFDVADLYRGPVGDARVDEQIDAPVDEKLRQAYFWIVNHAIISPYYDIEYQ